MAKDSKILKRDTGVRTRVFTYNLGVCNLSFTLRTDVKQELKEYVTLLEAALKDVKEELASK